MSKNFAYKNISKQFKIKEFLQETSSGLNFNQKTLQNSQDILNGLNSLESNQDSLQGSQNSLSLNHDPGGVSHVMSEIEFRTRSKSELKKICQSWKAVTFFEIKLTSLGKSPIYDMVSNIFYYLWALHSSLLKQPTSSADRRGIHSRLLRHFTARGFCTSPVIVGPTRV